MAALLVVAAGAAWNLGGRWRVRPLPPASSAFPSTVLHPDGSVEVLFRDGAFVSTVAVFRDELFAYMMFQNYRSTEPFKQEELLLRYAGAVDRPRYEILLVLNRDYAGSLERIAALQASHAIPDLDWRLCAPETLLRYRNQSRLFVAAYNLPVRRTMEELSPHELRSLVRRFIRYKSSVDPRVRRRIEPVPTSLTTHEAQQLAGDIIAVSEFYSLPLDLFLGIGAMENNYMSVRGDLTHSVWKRRAAKDDVVLERRRGRVRVLNDSAGVWQITRETLRVAQKLYLKDTRDYRLLPEHLRPPRTLNVKEVSPPVLTTYAGLLLRDLLDRFHGDVTLAVGAYNGGPGNPNMRYEAGVRAAAQHARSLLEHAAGLNGESVTEVPWLSSP